MCYVILSARRARTSLFLWPQTHVESTRASSRITPGLVEARPLSEQGFILNRASIFLQTNHQCQSAVTTATAFVLSLLITHDPAMPSHAYCSLSLPHCNPISRDGGAELVRRDDLPPDDFCPLELRTDPNSSSYPLPVVHHRQVKVSHVFG